MSQGRLQEQTLGEGEKLSTHILVLHPSSAQLGSARIQLELEASQLGSARKNFESARGAKKLNYRAGFEAFFSSN